MENFSKKYLNVLHGTLRGLNLTKIAGEEEFFFKQIMDSSYPLLMDTEFNRLVERTKLVIDIGFGGGFPILPMAYLRPHVQFIGFESTNKKVEAVKVICNELNINNVKVYHRRFQDILFNKNCVITFKAVGKSLECLREIHTNEQIYIYFFKGPNFFKLEGDDLEKISKKWDLKEKYYYDLKGTQGRYLIGFQNKNIYTNFINDKNNNNKKKNGNKILVNLTEFL